MGFTAWARFVNPTALEAKGFGEINVPVTVGGLEVAPGDWIVGDDTGLVRISEAQRLAEIANRAMDVPRKGKRLREEIREGSTLVGRGAPPALGKEGLSVKGNRQCS